MEKKLPLARITFALLFAIGLSVTPLFVSAQRTEAACIPLGRPNVYGNFFDGWYRNASLVTGVQSYIYSYSPYVYGASTVAWVMLAPYVGSGAQDRAQVGWLQHTNGVRKTFIQFTYYEAGTGTFKVKTLEDWAPQTIGLYASYQVEYNTSTGYTEFWYQGQKIYQTPASFTPQSAQTSAEVLNQKSQMPGGYGSSSDYEWFIYNYYQTSYGGPWTGLGGTQVTSFPSWYNFNFGDANNPHQSIYVSDKACAQ